MNELLTLVIHDISVLHHFLFTPYLAFFFFLNDPPTPEIYPLPLPDALPIFASESTALAPREGRPPCHCTSSSAPVRSGPPLPACSPTTASGSASSAGGASARSTPPSDRKSTRLNSSHSQISYAVFCLKTKKQ